MNTNLKDRRLYQQVILSHSKNPRNFGQTNPVDSYQKRENLYCGDRIEITIAWDRQTQKIADLKFQGSGCALCLASADLMIEAVKGKTVEETLAIVEHFHQVMLGQAELNPSLNKLKAIEGVKRYPIKIKCTTLPWHTLKAAIINFV